MPMQGPTRGRRAFRLLMAVVSGAGLCTAHGSSQWTARPDTVRAVIETYATLVHASYEDAYQVALALQAALHAFIARPSPATLEAARDAWKQARVPYGQTEVYRFYAGPIDAAEGPEGRLNAWPLDESYIDYVQGHSDTGIINDPAMPITREQLQGLNEPW